MKFLRDHSPVIAAGLVTAAFALVCTRFVWQPGLASLADDSVSYLVMAQVFSPWTPASAPVAEAFVREAFYPPLFPALLAAAGAAHHAAWAQALSALLLAGGLPLVYALGTRWLGSRGAAAAAVLATASLPALWIQGKGVLSEPLFTLLLLATLLAAETGAERPRGRARLALLLAALALTRTVGLVVAAGYAAWALARRAQPWPERMRTALPALAALAAYGAWVLLRPAGTADDYLRIVAERSHTALHADSLLAGLAFSALRQLQSMAQAWAGSVMIFWVEGQPLRLALAAAAGALALAGLALRFFAGKPDAWMTLAYLGTFLLWPFDDQMQRFIFPALPVLVLYALAAAVRFLGRLRRPVPAAVAIVAALLLSLSLPALGFIYSRARTAGPQTQITDWYRTPDLDEARRRARVHLDLMADMQAIRALTRPEHRIMWVTPSYIALLADRHGLPAPSAELAPAEYRLAVERSGADYVFLSRYHPRDTLRDTAWRAGLEALRGRAEAVHIRRRPEDGAESALLLKLK